MPDNEKMSCFIFMDTQGRLVKTIFTGTALKGVAQNYPVDRSSLREGLYIIKLKTYSDPKKAGSCLKRVIQIIYFIVKSF